jgi:phosphatidylglycerol lysyltransferase
MQSETTPPSAEPKSAEGQGSARAWWWKVLGGLIPAGLAALAFLAIRRELSEHSVADVTAAIGQMSALRVLLGFVMVAATYVMLSGYDVLAQVYGGKTLPYRQTLLTSFIAFAMGNALGFNALTGALVRLRLYVRQGLTALDAARITAFNLLTFWVGLGAAGGLSLLMGHLQWPPRAPTWLPTPRVAGVFLLLGLVGYLLACQHWTGRTLLRKAQILVPPFRLGVGQVLVGAGEWLCAAAILCVLLPSGAVGFGSVLGVFVVSMLLGLLSAVPGGLGIFETSALFFLGHDLGTPQVLGTLLVYRFIFTLTPFLMAIFLFAVAETRHRSRLKQAKAHK